MLLLACFMLGFAVFLVGEVATAPQRRRQSSLRRASHYGRAREEAENGVPRFKERVLVPGVERLATLTLRINPKTSVEAIGARLIAAGLASRVTTAQFLAVKAALAVGGIVAALLGAVAISAIAGVLLAP